MKPEVRTALEWAQALRKTLYLPVVTTEITIGFEGHKKDVNDLVFDLFEAGMLREGLQKNTPGGATVVLKPMEMRKRAFAHATPVSTMVWSHRRPVDGSTGRE
jgi:hypothetical protein